MFQNVLSIIWYIFSYCEDIMLMTLTTAFYSFYSLFYINQIRY